MTHTRINTSWLSYTYLVKIMKDGGRKYSHLLFSHHFKGMVLDVFRISLRTLG